VWLGKHQLLARPAAIKLIRADTGSDRDRRVRRFHREAQVTSGLRSPHTVQLYDFGLNDSGSFYYVMELLQGLDLQQIIARFGPLPPARAVFLLRQACWSLAEAHEQGLVHRDIKPANLFVTRLGPEYDFLKVLDFGMVKGEREGEATMLSSQGVVQGTPAFMAPELVTGESEPDGRTDLYSLACSAYQALSGRTVFEAASSTQMLLHHVRETPRPLRSVASQPIPTELDAIIARCLAKHPNERPDSALALDRELRALHLEPWTQDQARAWWIEHAPGAVA
jgi:serine/threonine-protein kinase